MLKSSSHVNQIMQLSAFGHNNSQAPNYIWKECPLLINRIIQDYDQLNTTFQHLENNLYCSTLNLE